jgi:GT2 family glycosyltransferase
MDLSICILTRHQPDLLPRCVGSCFSEIAACRINGEAIVIDNNSFDGSPQKVANQFPAVRLIRNSENLGFGTANNAAIRSSQAEYVLILNDDAILKEGSLRLMLEAFAHHLRVAIVGPKLLNPDGSVQRGFTNRRFPRLRALLFGFLGITPLLEKWDVTRDLLTHARDPEEGGETDHIAGACMLVRRKALDAVGLFDERFFYQFEDVDLCFRMKKSGWKVVYVPKAQVVHYGSASLGKLMWSRRRFIYFRSLKYFFDKHAGPARRIMLWLALSFALTAQVLIVAVLALIPGRHHNSDQYEPLGAALKGALSVLNGKGQ